MERDEIDHFGGELSRLVTALVLARPVMGGKSRDWLT